MNTNYIIFLNFVVKLLSFQEKDIFDIEDQIIIILFYLFYIVVL
jgi:hypothetical protein